jgi:hypothetical protein
MAKQQSSDGWAGWVMFASFMMIMVGFFQAIVGLTAILKDNFFVVTQNNLIQVDIATWGWVHLLLSILVIFAGYAVMDGKVWGRTLGVILALGGAVANLAFIPYAPIWSTLLVVINVVVIYALTVHGRALSE